MKKAAKRPTRTYATIESRVKTLEAAVADIQDQLDGYISTRPDDAPEQDTSDQSEESQD